jgi:hypothetical protein
VRRLSRRAYTLTDPLDPQQHGWGGPCSPPEEIEETSSLAFASPEGVLEELYRLWASYEHKVNVGVFCLEIYWGPNNSSLPRLVTGNIDMENS